MEKNNGKVKSMQKKELHCDKEAILRALEYDDSILDDLDDEFLEDVEILYKAVDVYPENYTYFDEDLQEDRDIALACVKIRGEVYEYLCDELKVDKEIIEEAIAHGASLKHIGDWDCRSDYETVASAIKNSGGDELRFASNDLRNNEKLVAYAIENGLSLISALGKEMRKNKSTIKSIIKNISLEEHPDEDKILDIMYLSEEMLQDEDFILELIAESELIFQVVCGKNFHKIMQRSVPYNQDADFCQRAYDINPKTLKFMGNAMKKSIKK